MKAMAMAALVLTGCAATTAAVPPAGAARCDAASVQDALGKAYATALGDDVRTRSGARDVRVIRPGEAVTMDYREDRVNIDLDDKGLVRAVRCG